MDAAFHISVLRRFAFSLLLIAFLAGAGSTWLRLKSDEGRALAEGVAVGVEQVEVSG